MPRGWTLSSDTEQHSPSRSTCLIELAQAFCEYIPCECRHSFSISSAYAFGFSLARSLCFMCFTAVTWMCLCIKHGIVVVKASSVEESLFSAGNLRII